MASLLARHATSAQLRHPKEGKKKKKSRICNATNGRLPSSFDSTATIGVATTFPPSSATAAAVGIAGVTDSLPCTSRAASPRPGGATSPRPQRAPSYMEHLMRMGSGDKADGYLQHFLPTPEHASPQSISLVLHLCSAWTLAVVSAAGPTAADFASNFDEFKGPAASNFPHVLHKMHANQPRASMPWKKIAPSAVDKALDLLAECPELKGKLHLPRDRPMPWEVIPLIGARGSTRRRSKPADRTPANVVIRALKCQKRLLSTLETDAYAGFPRNASSNSMAPNTKTEQNAPKPITLDGKLAPSSCLPSATISVFFIIRWKPSW